MRRSPSLAASPSCRSLSSSADVPLSSGRTLAGAIRQLNFRPKVYPTEFDRKAERLRGLLSDGVSVKLVVRTRGRETLHPEVAGRMLERLVAIAEESGATAGLIE